VLQLGTDVNEAQQAVEAFAIPPRPDQADLLTQIDALDRRIEAGEAIAVRYDRLVAQHADHSAALKQRDQLQAQLTRLEKLCLYFGSDGAGIRARLTGEYIGGFQESINQTLHAWGYHAELSIEPYGFRVSAHPDTRTEASLAAFPEHLAFSLHQLSQSERYRFAVAFQVALALDSDYKFVVIDGADILDQRSEGRLYNTLYESQLDQAIVLSTDIENRTNGAPGTAFLRLTEGPEGTAVEVLKVTPSLEGVTA
jgi:hypothetical protein